MRVPWIGWELPICFELTGLLQRFQTLGHEVPYIAVSSALNLLSLALPVVILQVYDRVIPNTSNQTLVVFVFGRHGIAQSRALQGFSVRAQVSTRPRRVPGSRIITAPTQRRRAGEAGGNGINVIHGGTNALRFTPSFDMTSAEVDLIVEATRDAIINGPVKEVDAASEAA